MPKPKALNAEQEAEVIRVYNTGGFTYPELAAKFNVSSQTIWRAVTGSTNRRKVLSEDEVSKLRHEYETSRITMKGLSTKYNVCISVIDKRLKGCNKIKEKSKKVESYCNWTKLTKEQAMDIVISVLQHKVPQAELAKKYNVHQATISNIIKGKSWKHLFQGIRNKYNTEILKVK